VNRGCIIGAGCVVGAGVVLPEFTRLTLAKEEEDDFGDGWGDESDEESESDHGERLPSPQEVVSDKHVVGQDGKGHVWQPPPEDDDDLSEDGLPPSALCKAQSMGFDPTRLLRDRQLRQEEADRDDFSEDSDIMDLEEYPDDDAVTFEPSPVQAVPIVGRQKGVDVIKELKTICLEYEPTSPIENLAIELNSFKFSQNATYSDCTMAAMLAILEKMNIQKGAKDGKLVADFKGYLEHWAPLLRKMSISIDEEKAVVVALEKSATEGGDMGEVLSTGMTFRFLLQTLHDEEVVSDEAILLWASERRDEEGSDSAVARLFQMKPVQEFLEWLEAESEEESGSEESEDDD
jgi:translation initiation factor eIF-2B subunit epsilon